MKIRFFYDNDSYLKSNITFVHTAQMSTSCSLFLNFQLLSCYTFNIRYLSYHIIIHYLSSFINHLYHIFTVSLTSQLTQPRSFPPFEHRLNILQYQSLYTSKHFSKRCKSWKEGETHNIWNKRWHGQALVYEESLLLEWWVGCHDVWGRRERGNDGTERIGERER